MPGCSGCGGGTLQDAILAVAPDMDAQPRWFWRSLPEEITDPMEESFRLWIGTPYREGTRVRGGGVNCTHLIVALLDRLFRRTEPTPIPRLPADASIHSKRKGFETIRVIRRAFPSFVVRDNIIEPGDIVVTRAFEDSNGPKNVGHVQMAGVTPWSAIHAMTQTGVQMTGIRKNTILRIYRVKDKASWACSPVQ